MTQRGRAAPIAVAAILWLGVAGDPAAALQTPGVGSDTTPGLPVLDVPYVPQTEALCGGAAAVMVMRYWGGDSVGVRAFEPLVDDSARGIRTAVLAGEIRSLGWRALAFRGSLSEIRRQLARGRPVIVLLRVAPDRYHYVVVVAVGDGAVLVHDPARAPFRRLAAEEFRREWAPTGAWSLLVLPARGDVGAPRAAAAVDSAAALSPSLPDSGRGGAPDAEPGAGAAPATAAAGAAACHQRVGDAVRMARDGDLAGAARVLEATAAACPDSASPLRELSGVRFRQRRWMEAANAARRALALQPGDAYTTRLLAGDLYMAGRREAALRTWNEVGEPRVSALRVYGLERVRYGVVARRVDLPRDSLLTPARLSLARRRLDAVPGFAASRVDWGSLGAGRAELRVAVLERRPLPGGVPGLVLALAAGLPQRMVSLRTGSLLGDGERWSAAWRWWNARPRLSVDVRTPDAFGITGIWDAGGSWEREAFRVRASSGTADTVREERARALVSISTWATAFLRWRVGASVDRWVGLGTAPGVVAGAELMASGDRVRVAADGSAWPGPGRAFGVARAEAGWRSSAGRKGMVLSSRVGYEVASAGAPLQLWPGAGTGHARATLLRAHPLLDGGVVTGPVFGRRVAYAGVEATGWVDALAPLAVGPALFADLARAWHRPGGGVSPVELDVGAGLRLALPGMSSLRLDVAHGLRDGENAVSIGWEAPWPGSDGRP